MIDIHTHLIHGVDDGSPDLETTIEHLKRIQDAGVKAVVLTSHYMRGSYNNIPALLDPKIEEIKAISLKEGITLDFYRGAEVFLAPAIHKDIEENDLSMNHTRYVLVETELNSFPADLRENLFQMLRAGYKPVLAHAERYVDIMNHVHDAEDLINRNVYLQINASSLMGGYGTKVKNTAWTLLEHGWAHFIASDEHCRTPHYPLHIAREMIADYIDEYTANLLTDVFPQRLLNDQDIPYEYVTVKTHRKRKSFWQKIFG